MVILYGFKEKTKMVKQLGNSVCVNCHHDTPQSLAKQKEYFTLFFIPVIGWTKGKFIYCPICGEARKLNGQEFKEIKQSTP